MNNFIKFLKLLFNQLVVSYYHLQQRLLPNSLMDAQDLYPNVIVDGVQNLNPQQVANQILHQDGQYLSSFGPSHHQNQQNDTDCTSQARYYYSLIFSSNETTKSIKLRNEALEHGEVESQYGKSQSNKDIIKRRKERVDFLQNKEKEQINILDSLYAQDPQKFESILEFLKFFSQLKKKVKVDYYSHKTFCAIKGASTNQLIKLLFIMKKIYNESRQQTLIDNNLQINKQKQSLLIKQFLIVPRFLISKEKIQEFIKDQQIQNSFKFLVSKLCLGHENNQANKKMPDKQLINLLKGVLEKDNGKQIFKTICSINHGNKFRLDHGNLAYIQLYNKKLETLKNLDKQNKKNSKRCDFHISNKSKSGIQMESDEDFLPTDNIKKSQSKLKTRLSLNLNQLQKPIQNQKSKSKLKHTQSCNANYDQSIQMQLGINSDVKTEHNFSFFQLSANQNNSSPFLFSHHKIKQNLILIKPPEENRQK